MDNGATKDGWQRFLDRLKELWGRRADEERGNKRPAGSPGILEPLRAPGSASPAMLAARRAQRTAPMDAWEDEGGAWREQSAPPAHFRFCGFA
jgi:hypothetical protein